MKRKLLKYSILCAFISILALPAGCLKINGAGGYLVSTLYQKIMFGYRVLNPNLQFSVDGIGSLAAIQALESNEVEFAGSDVPLSQESYESYPDMQTYPTVVAALAFYHNLGATRMSNNNLLLSRSTISDIYLGNICSWNHSELRKLNPGTNLPNASITLYVWNGPAALTLILSKGLSMFSEKFANTIGNSTSPNWCAGSKLISSFVRKKGRMNFQCQECCSTSSTNCCRTICKVPGASMIHAISADEFSLGYATYDPANTASVQIASMINKAGAVVTPSSDSLFYATLELGSMLDAKLNADLLDCSSKYGWPLATYSYLVLRKLTQISTCEVRADIVKFWYWFYETYAVRQVITDAGFAPLPQTFVDAITSVLVEETMCVVADAKFPYTIAAPELMEVQTINFLVSDVMPPVFDSVIEAFNLVMDSSFLYRWSYSPANSTTVFLNDIGGFYSPDFLDETKYPYRTPVFVAPYLVEGIVPVYTLSNLKASLNVTVQLLSDIYTCGITTWHDERLVHYNPELAALNLTPKRIILVSSTQQSDTKAFLLRYFTDNVPNFSPAKFLQCANASVFASEALMLPRAQLTDGAFSYTTLSLAVSFNFQMVTFISKDSHGNAVRIEANNQTVQNCLSSPDATLTFKTEQFLILRLPIEQFEKHSCWPFSFVLYVFLQTRFKGYPVVGCSIAKESGVFVEWLLESALVSEKFQSASIVMMSSQFRKKSASIFKQSITCDGVHFLMNYPKCTAEDYSFHVTPCQVHMGKQERVLRYYLSNNTDCQGGVKLPADVHLECDYIARESIFGIALSAFALACILLFACMLVFKIWDWQHFFSKLTTPRYGMNELACFLAVIISILVTALEIGPTTDASCAVRPWLYFGIPDAIFSIYFSKVKVGHEIFQQRGITKVKVTFERILKGCAKMMIPEWCILVVWSAMSSAKDTVFLTALQVDEHVCFSVYDPIFFITLSLYKICWLIRGLSITIQTLIGTNLAFQMWNLKNQQGETRFIAFGMFNYMICTGVIMGFGSFGISEPLYTSLATSCAVLWISNTTCVIMSWLYVKSKLAALKSSQPSLVPSKGPPEDSSVQSEVPSPMNRKSLGQKNSKQRLLQMPSFMRGFGAKKADHKVTKGVKKRAAYRI